MCWGFKYRYKHPSSENVTSREKEGERGRESMYGCMDASMHVNSTQSRKQLECRSEPSTLQAPKQAFKAPSQTLRQQILIRIDTT